MADIHSISTHENARFPDHLWGITSYFNPARYRRQLANYRVFRRHLQLPLVTVELSFGADFDLHPGAAEILVQLRGGDVMWQKERLLNLALAALPSACRKVVSIDCDTIVGSDDWPQRVSRALDDYPLVQPFSRLCHLEPDACVNGLDRLDKIAFSESSFIYEMHRGGRPWEDAPGWTKRGDAGTFALGSIWAARRDLLDAHGFFDACIVGGGDTALISAAFGDYDHGMRNHALNERQREYYRIWAEPFFADVQAAVTYVEGPVFHLWHGAMQDRRYRDRHEGLRPFHFDPFHDLARAECGAWRWNSDKPRLHQYVKDYFALRKEDG